jgi:phage terminase large subunit-like protein
MTRFIESLKVTSGALAGQPFTLRPWQRQIIDAWYAQDASGHRLVRTGLLTMGRKNGKTGLCSALALAHLVGPEAEARGQVVAAASDRDQAALIFDEVVAFINDNPAFQARTNIQRHAKLIEDLVTGTKFRTMSSDAGKAHGLSPSLIVVDELAQWGHGAGRELFNALSTATGARASPLTLVISTQTADAHALMSELIEYGKQVNAGRITDPTFSAHIFEVPLEADPFDEALWPLANPALGDFRSLPEMQNFAARARRVPSQLATFRTYYLNQQVTQTQAWLPLDEWDACRVQMVTLGRQIYVGLDMAATTDLCALVVLSPDDAGGYDVAAEFWCPLENIAERSRTDRVPYELWHEQGFLQAMPGKSVDHSVIEARIHALMAAHQVERVSVDPWNAGDMIRRLERDGVPVIAVPQTMANLTTPSKALETLILSGKLHHDGHPILRWCVANAVADVDGNGNVKPSKKRSREKIDGVSALVTALDGALREPGSIYERRGLLVV